MNYMPDFSTIFKYLFYISIIIAAFLFISNFITKQKSTFLKIGVFISKFLYAFLMIPSFLFIIYDLTIGHNFTTEIEIKRYNYILDFCQITFSAGIFSASLKFLDALNVFKKNFKEIIISDEFKGLLSDNIEKLAYSEDHLIKQNNLNDIWERVTLCKYKKDFSEIHFKLKTKIKNDLFSHSTISYYYKNFQVNYNIVKIDDEHISITENSTFTIVRPNTESFDFEFEFNQISECKENEEIVLGLQDAKFSYKKQGGIVYGDINKNVIPLKDGTRQVKITKELKGQKEYHLSGVTDSIQKLSEDRVFAFGSYRIIDDLTVFIDHCNKINVIFSPTGNNSLKKNDAFPKRKLAFINRDVLLPGEKFKLFFH